MTCPINRLPPIHPGELFADDIEALGLSGRKFAEHIGVPHNAVNAILKGERSISALMAIRIGRDFGTSPEVWLNLQRAYDLKVAD